MQLCLIITLPLPQITHMVLITQDPVSSEEECIVSLAEENVDLLLAVQPSSLPLLQGKMLVYLQAALSGLRPNPKL